MNPEDRVKELRLELPPPPKPAGVYKPVVVVGNMAYVSGHGPLKSDGTMMTGRVGAEIDKDGGYLAAKQVGLTILTTLRSQLGTLNRIKGGIYHYPRFNTKLGLFVPPDVDAVAAAIARKNGMRNLREDGWMKVGQGVTTPEEVIRVTQEF